MKLQTSIAPRRDGTVKVTGQDSQIYVFEADADGELTCDVADKATVAALLAGGAFWPADTNDFAAAESLVGAVSQDDANKAAVNAGPIEAKRITTLSRLPRKAKAE